MPKANGTNNGFMDAKRFAQNVITDMDSTMPMVIAIGFLSHIIMMTIALNTGTSIAEGNMLLSGSMDVQMYA